MPQSISALKVYQSYSLGRYILRMCNTEENLFGILNTRVTTYVYVPMRGHLCMVAGMPLCPAFSPWNPRLSPIFYVFGKADMLKVRKSATYLVA